MIAVFVGLMILFIGILFPIIAMIKGYYKSSILLWIGFIALIFTRPWHEFTGFEGLFEAMILMFIVFPCYGVGNLSWFIGFVIRMTNRKDMKKEEQK